MSDSETGTNAIEQVAGLLKSGDKPAEAAAAVVETKQGEPAKTDDELGEGGKKALEAERNARKELEKKLSATATRLAELERANESESERAQRELREAQQVAATAPVQAFREAAVTFGGITTEDAELFLNGSDVETLRKQALRLVERTTAAAPATPRPDLTQGAQQAPALNSDELTNALARAVGR